MEEYEAKLNTLECPFNWKIVEITNVLPTPDLIDKLAEKEEEVSEPWDILCINLTNAYIYYENKKYIKSKEVLQNCEKLLKTDSVFVKKYEIPIQFILSGCRAILASKLSLVAEVKELVENILQHSDLSELHKSAVFAIKASVFMEFGVNGTRSAVPFAREALKLNQLEGKWHFLMGKLLSRVRHFVRDHMPTDEELGHLQTAQELLQSPHTAVFLACVSLEKSRTLSYKAKNNREYRVNEIDELVTNAKRLIFLAIEQNVKEDVHIMIRCAYGLSHLPFHIREPEKAKKILQEALKRSPLNSMGNKLAGDLFAQGNNPLYDQALIHYKIAASKNVFSAELLSFEISVKMGKNPDPENFYSRLLSQYKEGNYQLQTLMHACEFYMFVKRDIFKALHYFLELVTIAPEYDCLKNRFVKYIKKNVNFYELMANESRIAIDNNLYKSDDEQQLLKKTLLKMKDHNPKLMSQEVQNNLVDKMIKDAEEEISKNVSGEKGRGRGMGRGRGRGGMGGGRGRGGKGRGRGRGRGPTGRERNEYVGSRESMNNEENRENKSQRGGYKNYRGKPNSSVNNTGKNFKSRNINEDWSEGANRGQNQYNGSLESSSINKKLQELQAQRDSVLHPSRQSKDPMLLATMRHKNLNVESIDNPYFVRYLEERYRKRNHQQTFEEWLEKSSTFFESPACSNEENTFKPETKVTHEVMEDIRQKFLKLEMKAEDSKKNCKFVEGFSSCGLRRSSERSPSLDGRLKSKQGADESLIYGNKQFCKYSDKEKSSKNDDRDYKDNQRSVYPDVRRFSEDEYDKYPTGHAHLRSVSRERKSLGDRNEKYSRKHAYARLDSLDREKEVPSFYTSIAESRSQRRKMSSSRRESKIRPSRSSGNSISPSSYRGYKRSSRYSSRERRHSGKHNSRNDSDEDKKPSRRGHSTDSWTSRGSRYSSLDEYSGDHSKSSRRGKLRDRSSPRKIIDKTSSRQQRSHDTDTSQKKDIIRNRHRSKERNGRTSQKNLIDRKSPSRETEYVKERYRRQNSRDRSSSNDKYRKAYSPIRSCFRNEHKKSRTSSHSKRSKNESLRDSPEYSHERRHAKKMHKKLSDRNCSSCRSTSSERFSKASSKRSSVYSCPKRPESKSSRCSSVCSQFEGEYNRKIRNEQAGDIEIKNPNEADKKYFKRHVSRDESNSDERYSRQSSMSRSSGYKDKRRNRDSSQNNGRQRNKSERENFQERDESVSRGRRYSKASDNDRRQKSMSKSDNSSVSEYNKKSTRSNSKKRPTSGNKYAKHSRHNSSRGIARNEKNDTRSQCSSKIKKISRESSSERKFATEKGDNRKYMPSTDKCSTEVSTEISSKFVEEEHLNHGHKLSSIEKPAKAEVRSRFPNRYSSESRDSIQDDLENKSIRLSSVD